MAALHRAQKESDELLLILIASCGGVSLRAALRRAAMDETATTLGLSTATAFIDVWKYYDSINLVKLARAMLALRMDPTTLAMHLLLYLGVRIIRADQCCSLPLEVTNSIAQGCGRATDMARGLLHSFLDLFHHQLPRQHHQQHHH